MNRRKDSLIDKIINFEFLAKDEALYLYHNLSLNELIMLGNYVRNMLHPNKKVSWLIDRNVNITNVCVSGCLFCNFHCKYGDTDAFITSLEEYDRKIKELFLLGGDQLLIQGGMHPKLDLSYYEELFHELKRRYPSIKLHALGPPEIIHLARKANLNISDVLNRLINAGLDSLPGAGAEILTDEIRCKLSKYKCTSDEWLDVMREAHKYNLITSATMMFGHIETIENRIEHIIKIRDLQAQRPKNATGFISFICWPFQSKGTLLLERYPEIKEISNVEYLKMIAISRIMLVNISNIQVSWLTVGYDTAQLALHAGANDMGSIMIEENVVSAAGAQYKIDIKGMKSLIKSAGYIPVRRNQKYEIIDVEN